MNCSLIGIRPPHVHIGGPVRSGKTSLALRLQARLWKAYRLRSGLIDVDETRTATFGADEPILGTLDPKNNPDDQAKFDLQKKMQGWSYNNIFAVQIPLVANAGAVPIFTATHASRFAYDKAKAAAEKLGDPFKFILLGDIDIDELDRRCRADIHSKSDMKDPLNNPTEMENHLNIANRIHDVYDGIEDPICRIPQGDPDEMTNIAIRYVMER